MKTLTQRAEAARSDPLFSRIVPTKHRLIVTVPLAQGTPDLRTNPGGELTLPASDERSRRTWGETCIVLKVGSDCDPAIKDGTTILIHEYAGDIIRDDDRETEIAIIGTGDIMAYLI